MILSEEQKRIINATNHNMMIFAGPGTGKTFTLLSKVVDLVERQGTDPKSIFILTFTRAAAKDLRIKIDEQAKALKWNESRPYIYTMHAFALRQLMNNSSRIRSLPEAFCIANDFEERKIVEEDMKRLLGIGVREVQGLFMKLSANWETLKVDEGTGDYKDISQAFVGTWQEHRSVYGYVLRSELVYQFLKMLQYEEDIRIDGPIGYLIVDEYQDLNKCDISIIDELNKKGARLFCAGDDDQSIYGFRYAFPEGIIGFASLHDDVGEFEITECRRCDKAILRVATEIISQDPRRRSKNLFSVSENEGEVHLLRFDNQIQEATKIAELIRNLRDDMGIEEKDIILLTRNESKFTAFYEDVLRRNGVKIDEQGKFQKFFNTEMGMEFLAIAKYVLNPKNDLALRVILQLTKGIGAATIDEIYKLARDNKRFCIAVEEICGGIINNVIKAPKIRERIAQIQSLSPELIGPEKTIREKIELVLSLMSKTSEEFRQNLFETCEENGMESLEDIIKYVDDIVSKSEISDEGVLGVRVMTMHKAKGLTAKAVFIAAAEDEYIPGGNSIEEERRLLYVSLTRAKNVLIITYCKERDGQQKYSGINPKKKARHITRFLRDNPNIIPKVGQSFRLPSSVKS